MKTIGAWILMSLLALPSLAMAQVNSLPSQPHLLVKGDAEREVEPDRFTLKISLESVDASPALARRRVQQNAERVLATFARAHALDGSIQASSLSIEPKTRYKDDEDVFVGTEVGRELSATFSSLDDVRSVLAELKTSEELQVSGISPGYADEAKVRAELKRQAADQTRESARELAAAYGMRITGIYTISDVAPDFAYGVRAGQWHRGTSVSRDRSASSPMPARSLDAIAVTGARAESLEAGSITLTENIYAIFLIAP